MSALNRKTTERVAGGQGTTVAKETNFNKLKRLIELSVIGEERYYPTGTTPMEDIIELSKNLKKSELDKFINLIEYTRLEIGLRHSVIHAIVGAIEGGHGEILDKLNSKVMLRPTDIQDLIALYLDRGNKKTLPKKLKRFLNKALNRYDEYQFAKYGRNKKGLNVNLVDVLNLVHPIPKDENQNRLFKAVTKQENLPMPETWEHMLSNSGKKAKKVWKKLLKDKKLPSLATLRNVRNMEKAGVKVEKIVDYIQNNVSVNRIFPTQIIQAYNSVEDEKIKEAIISLIFKDKNPVLKGKTLIVLDISGSMGIFSLNSFSISNYSARAMSIAIALMNNTEDFDLVLTSGNDSQIKHASKFVNKKIRSIKDFISEIDKGRRELGIGGIFTYQVLNWIKEQTKGGLTKKENYERVVVISDSQDCDRFNKNKNLPLLGKYNYVNNIAAYKRVAFVDHENGFKEITTFSSKIVDYMLLNEKDFD